MTRGLRTWLPDATIGVAVAGYGVVEVLGRDGPEARPTSLFLVALGVGAAIGLSRRLPAASLALSWLIGLFQAASHGPLLPVELALIVVGFGCARWGRTGTVVLSGVSIPLSATVAVLWLDPYTMLDTLYDSGLGLIARTAVDRYAYADGWRLTLGVVGVAVLAAPWLAGLALRYGARARQSSASRQVAEVEREQAQEVARLREEQARLARDVHDVVGHSLAVILAQAESAQYLDELDTTRLKATMQNIAASARGSLQDVRVVLAGDEAPPPRPGALDDLVAGVRASGHQVEASSTGIPRPLPPDRATVAYRVLQELLTNAIRHGRRDAPISVHQGWAEELTLDVTNHLGPPAPGSDGQGLDGIRRRLAAVEGSFETHRASDGSGPTFRAVARLPIGERR